MTSLWFIQNNKIEVLEQIVSLQRKSSATYLLISGCKTRKVIVIILKCTAYVLYIIYSNLLENPNFYNSPYLLWHYFACNYFGFFTLGGCSYVIDDLKSKRSCVSLE